MTMVRLAWKKRFFAIFGRTDLRISLSGAKFDAEASFDVRSAAAPLKPPKIHEKIISETKKSRICFPNRFFDVSGVAKRRRRLEF